MEGVLWSLSRSQAYKAQTWSIVDFFSSSVVAFGSIFFSSDMFLSFTILTSSTHFNPRAQSKRSRNERNFISNKEFRPFALNFTSLWKWFAAAKIRFPKSFKLSQFEAKQKKQEVRLGYYSPVRLLMPKIIKSAKKKSWNDNGSASKGRKLKRGGSTWQNFRLCSTAPFQMSGLWGSNDHENIHIHFFTQYINHFTC